MLVFCLLYQQHYYALAVTLSESGIGQEALQLPPYLPPKGTA